MEEIINMKSYYDNLIRKLSKKNYDIPSEYKLRVSNCNGQRRYYLRKGTSDKCGKYILKEDVKIAKMIAQRDYDVRVNKCAKEWRDYYDKLIKSRPELDLKDIYEMSKNRKELIIPYEISDEEFAQQWENVEYEGKDYNFGLVEIYTEKGERVRSKSEKLIADKLYMMNIPYRYEYPVYLDGMGTVYSDFRILNVSTREEFILEHFGMMDDEEYSAKAVMKMNTYAKNGYTIGDKLLVTFETKDVPFDVRNLQAMLINKGF